MEISSLFFDLDDTLYPRDNGVWQAVLERIERFMGEEVGIAPEEIAPVREHYLMQFGTTLRGLMVDYGVNPDHYLDYVHQVPVEDLLAPNPALVDMLVRLPQSKYVFTNASRAHALRVLKGLGIEDCFKAVLSIESLDYVSKPAASVYTLALRLAGNSPAAGSLYLDDRAANLAPAKTLGMTTVLVGDRGGADGADYHLDRVEELIVAMPWLVE